MNRPRSAAAGLLAGLVMLCASVGAASAAGAADGKYLLRLKLKPGDKLVYSIRVDVQRNNAPDLVKRWTGEEASSVQMLDEGGATYVVTDESPKGVGVMCDWHSGTQRVTLDGERDITKQYLALLHTRDVRVMLRDYCHVWIDKRGQFEPLARGQARSYRAARALAPLLIPLPKESVRVGDAWRGVSSHHYSTYGWHCWATAEAIEDRKGYRCMRIRCMSSPKDRASPPKSLADGPRGAETIVWWAIEEGFAVEARHSLRTRKETKPPGRSSLFFDAWHIELQNRVRLDAAQLAKCKEGLPLLQAAQEFLMPPGQEEAGIASLRKFAEFYPHSPWAETAAYREWMFEKFRKEWLQARASRRR